MIYRVGSEIHTRCICNLPEHELLLYLDEEDDDVYVRMALSDAVPWYKRIYLACKYVLGIGEGKCEFTEIITPLKDLEDVIKELKK